MRKEARKSDRRVFRKPAAILNADGSLFGMCTMLDVSVTGAKVKLEGATEAPNEFILLLSKDGKVRRRCKVLWRKETEIGVQFVIGSRPRR
jgi:PilZ domain